MSQLHRPPPQFKPYFRPTRTLELKAPGTPTRRIPIEFDGVQCSSSKSHRLAVSSINLVKDTLESRSTYEAVTRKINHGWDNVHRVGIVSPIHTSVKDPEEHATIVLWGSEDPVTALEQFVATLHCYYDRNKPVLITFSLPKSARRPNRGRAAHLQQTPGGSASLNPANASSSSTAPNQQSHQTTSTLSQSQSSALPNQTSNQKTTTRKRQPVPPQTASHQQGSSSISQHAPSIPRSMSNAQPSMTTPTAVSASYSAVASGSAGGTSSTAESNVPQPPKGASSPSTQRDMRYPTASFASSVPAHQTGTQPSQAVPIIPPRGGMASSTKATVSPVSQQKTYASLFSSQHGLSHSSAVSSPPRAAQSSVPQPLQGALPPFVQHGPASSVATAAHSNIPQLVRGGFPPPTQHGPSSSLSVAATMLSSQVTPTSRTQHSVRTSPAVHSSGVHQSSHIAPSPHIYHGITAEQAEIYKRSQFAFFPDEEHKAAQSLQGSSTSHQPSPMSSVAQPGAQRATNPPLHGPVMRPPTHEFSGIATQDVRDTSRYSGIPSQKKQGQDQQKKKKY